MHFHLITISLDLSPNRKSKLPNDRYLHGISLYRSYLFYDLLHLESSQPTHCPVQFNQKLCFLYRGVRKLDRNLLNFFILFGSLFTACQRIYGFFTPYSEERRRERFNLYVTLGKYRVKVLQAYHSVHLPRFQCIRWSLYLADFVEESADTGKSYDGFGIGTSTSSPSSCQHQHVVDALLPCKVKA